MTEKDSILNVLQAKLKREVETHNLTPMEDIDNLSPADLHNILCRTFDKSSPVGFSEDVDNTILKHVPFLELSLRYFEILQDRGKIKLTKRGNLPRNICFELYDSRIILEDYIERGIVKLNKEGDTIAIQNVKIISLLCGLTKKRKNEISMTLKGEEYLQEESKKNLFELLFRTNCLKFNLGYHDGYPQGIGIQETLGYTLYLLLRYGSEERQVDFYIDKMITAFPSILNHFEERGMSSVQQFRSCYETRVLERFLKYYNFIQYDNKRSPLSSKGPIDLKTTNLFRAIFELRDSNFKFKKSGHWA